ncbi:MAG: thioesterase family protein [Bacteroidota bacterium]
MIVRETQIRVRYAETDQMGVVYYGVYPQYFEVGRAEFIRDMGLSYREMEALGVMMPVVDMHVRYLRPARYDEMLRLRTSLAKLPNRRITLRTEVFNEADALCSVGKVTLTFFDRQAGTTIPAPAAFLKTLQAHWPREES